MFQIQVIYASSSHILNVFWEVYIFVQAKGSLWDLRYFFSTNNLRLVKIFIDRLHIIQAQGIGRYRCRFDKIKYFMSSVAMYWEIPQRYSGANEAFFSGKTIDVTASCMNSRTVFHICIPPKAFR